LKSKYLLPLLFSIILILIMVATSCTPLPQATPTETTSKPAVTTTVTVTPKVVTTDKVYRALNPVGISPPVEIKSLSPRLDTLDGKVIYVNQGEADPIIMPALIERLKKDYTKTTWKYIASSSFGPNEPEEEVLKDAKAVIRGIAW
jgi:hypothetical protein